MRNKKTADEAIRANIEDSARYAGVEALAFTSIECPTSQGRYHAIGVFRAAGKLRVRSQSDDFSTRIARSAKDLYLDTLYTVADEGENARAIAARWNDLPPVLAMLIDDATK